MIFDTRFKVNDRVLFTCPDSGNQAVGTIMSSPERSPRVGTGIERKWFVRFDYPLPPGCSAESRTVWATAKDLQRLEK